jgi:chitodextrinase
VVLDWNGDDLYTTDPTRFVYWQGTPYSSLSSFRSGTGQELQGLSVEPEFVNPETGDFGLMAGSALIDAGVLLPGINDDYVGDGPDIGAHEYIPDGDTTPPTVPTGLTAAAISSTQINLSWTASTDNVGVTGYRIYRNGGQITTTSGTSYQDAGRSPSTTYTYRVAAYDAAGNLSAQSSQASATTPATPDTTPPVISSVASSGITSNGATITWSTNEASDSQVEYGLTASYGSSTTLKTNLVTNHSVVLSGLSASTTYHYRVKSKDAATNAAVSGDYSFITPAPLDTQAPMVPKGLKATVISSTQINLSWMASTDNVAVAGYKIYQNNIEIGTTASTSYQSTGLNANTSYTYRVAAYDGAGNTSTKSVGVTTKTQPLPSTVFTIGDRVQTTWKVTVRSTPSNSGTASGTQLKGAIGRVAGGPVYSNLQWWWQIDFDSGVDGWVPQGKLKKVIP